MRDPIARPAASSDALAEALHAARPVFARASWSALSEQIDEAAALHALDQMEIGAAAAHGDFMQLGYLS